MSLSTTSTTLPCCRSRSFRDSLPASFAGRVLVAPSAPPMCAWRSMSIYPRSISSTSSSVRPSCCSDMVCLRKRPRLGSRTYARTSSWIAADKKLPWMVETPRGGCAGIRSMPITRPSGFVRFTATCDHDPGAKPCGRQSRLAIGVKRGTAYKINNSLARLEQLVLLIELLWISGRTRGCYAGLGTSSSLNAARLLRPWTRASLAKWSLPWRDFHLVDDEEDRTKVELRCAGQHAAHLAAMQKDTAGAMPGPSRALSVSLRKRRRESIVRAGESAFMK
jgi:hypothetical protein